MRATASSAPQSFRERCETPAGQTRGLATIPSRKKKAREFPKGGLLHQAAARRKQSSHWPRIPCLRRKKTERRESRRASPSAIGSALKRVARHLAQHVTAQQGQSRENKR